jgi:Zn-dependent M16 (insulinase) family peptidase
MSLFYEALPLINPLNRYRDSIISVTEQDIKEVVGKYFSKRSSSIALLGQPGGIDQDESWNIIELGNDDSTGQSEALCDSK